MSAQLESDTSTVTWEILSVTKEIQTVTVEISSVNRREKKKIIHWLVGMSWK